MRYRVVLSIGLFAGLSLGSAGPGKTAAAPLRVELTSDVLVRQLVVEDGQLRTEQIVNQVTGQTLCLTGDQASAHREFEIRLASGRCLSSKDYRVSEHKTSQIQDRQAEIFTLQPLDPTNPHVQIEYQARRHDHFLRKRVTVTGSSTVETIRVEDLEVPLSGKRGGFGQPLLLSDSWFCGLEYPAGENRLANNRLSLMHWPGRPIFTSQWAVIGGIGVRGATIEEEFDAYLTTIRRPPRPSLQYNGWFDLRGGEITAARLDATLELFENRLLTPYGLAFDAFVLDHGYENPKTLWQCSAHWPEGLEPFARRLARSGSRLGLWLPLNGYLLDPGLGRAEGWERSNHRKGCFCLAGPHYQSALKDALRRVIKEGNVAYLKHDFNFLACGRDGHGHRATEPHGREANVDAQIDLLAYERELQPNIFQNVTSNLWPSPWWLAHCDSLWMGGSDYAQLWETPQDCDRSAEMTFRDSRLYRLLRLDQIPIPASALMTHGIIRGRYEAAHPEESLREWSDYVLMYFGRGTMLHELYLSPDLMPETFWPVLAKAIRWARSNTETLAHTRMIGGDPRDALYGYVHWSASKGILCLRNPTSKPARYELSLRERPIRLPNQDAWEPIVIYPYRERLPTMHASDRNGTAVTVPAHSVMIVEMHAELAEPLMDVPLGRFDIAEEEGSAQLICYQEAALPPMEKLEPVEQDKKSWSVSLLQSGHDNITDRNLVVTRTPAHGATVHWTDHREMIAETSHTPDWDICRYPLDASRELKESMDVALPPTPLFPQTCQIDAILETTLELEESSTISLSAGAVLPDWPLAPDAKIHREQSVIIDQAVLVRRRSPAESIAWVILLGALPFGGVAFVSRHWTMGRPRWLRCGTLLLAAVTLAYVYWSTPLGIALSRALSEARP